MTSNPTAADRQWSVLANLPALPAAAGLCAGVVAWTLYPGLILPILAFGVAAVILWQRHFVVGTVLLSLGLGWSAASLNVPVSLPAQLFDGHETQISGSVVRVVPKSYRNLLIIRVDSIGNNRVPSFDVAVSDGGYSVDAVPGNLVRATVVLQDVNTNPFPGKKNYYRNLGVSASGTAMSGDLIVTDHSTDFTGFWFRQRMKLSSMLAESRLSAEAFGLLDALILGLGDDLPSDYRENFRLAGTAHVLALSGFHVTFVYSMISLLLFPLGVSWRLRKLRLILGILAIWSYVLLTGMSPGVVRAGIGLSVVLGGLFTGRYTVGLNNLCVAVAVMVCVWPFSIFLAGLQLSVCATAGILLFSALFSPEGQSVWKFRIVNLIAVPCGAVFATAPLLMYYFHSLPVLFVVSNLIAVIIIAPLVWIGAVRILFTAVGWTAPWLDSVINFVVDLTGNVFGTIASFGATLNLGISAAQTVVLLSACVIVAVVVTRSHYSTALRWAVPLALLLCVTPLFSESIPESEAFVSRHGGKPVVIVRHGRSAAALVNCPQHEFHFYADRIRADLTKYNRGCRADTLLITRKNVKLGPFVRQGDSLYIDNQVYSFAELTRGDLYRIY